MKTKAVLFGYLLMSVAFTLGQGRFLGVNSTAATRIGSPTGPVAGTNILGQFLLGLTTDSLTPVGMPATHLNGFARGGIINVDGLGGDTPVWLQLLVWDRTLWGEDFSTVPGEQLGRTDIAPHVLSFAFDPASVPNFLVPAIVPVPEPSAIGLSVLGCAVLWRSVRRRSAL